MKHFTYLLIDIGCILVPLIFSFHKKFPFYKKWKYFIPANILVAIAFLVWDEYFTRIGVWGFNPDYLTGIYIGKLPVEEILFFICIPYACVFTYFALKSLQKESTGKAHRTFTMLLLAVLVISSFFTYELKYTFSTSIGTICFLSILLWQRIDMTRYYQAYFLILPFFFASNGILTGSLLDKPIVWYNNVENLGIRMFTIPIEDSVYGFLLIVLNIYLFDLFQRKKTLIAD